MKIILLFCFFVFLISCTGNTPQNLNASLAPDVESTLTAFEKATEEYTAEKNKKQLEKFIKDTSKYHKLLTLKDKNPQGEDFEARVWRFSAFNDKNLTFTLKRANENWSANLVQTTIAEKYRSELNPPKKYFTRELEKPKSGWENLWQKLIDAQILTLPNGRGIGNEPFPDSWSFVVETKVGGRYRVFEYFGPELFKNNEAQQMTKIINIISEEFDLNDFDENNFVQP